jgi:hypothetical protein
MWALHKLLEHQIETGPPLLPGNVHDADKFMADWMTTLKKARRS